MKEIFTPIALLFTVTIHAMDTDTLPALKASPTGTQEKKEAAPRTGFLRCAGSKTCTEPVIVIDGIMSDNKGPTSVNPCDIISITILKDAEAMSLYGYRAAAGVIIIVTKASLVRRFIIKDLVNGAKIPRATICFTSGNDSVNTVTDSSGVLVTDKLKRGVEYNITVSSVGYKTIVTTNAGKDQEILLEREIKECSNVIVTCYDCVRTISCGYRVERIRPGPTTLAEENVRLESIYPNPVQRSSSFNLELTTTHEQTLQLMIFSVNGNMVLSTPQRISKGWNQLRIATDARWAAGMYNVQLRNEKGILIRQEKLIVQ